MSNIRVAHVDDHELIRDGLSTAADAAAGPVRIVWSGSSVDALMRDWHATGLDFDVAVLDIVDHVTGPCDPQAVAALTEAGKTVVMFSGFVGDAPITPYWRAGARTIVSKDLPNTELLTVLEDAACGRHRLDAAAEAELDDPAPECPQITDAERAVLAVIVTGVPDRVAAKRLGLSVHTVSTHMANVASKFSATGQPLNRTGIAVRAVELGIVDTGTPGRRSHRWFRRR